jgi:hypothetical protein
MLYVAYSCRHPDRSYFYETKCSKNNVAEGSPLVRYFFLFLEMSPLHKRNFTTFRVFCFGRHDGSEEGVVLVFYLSSGFLLTLSSSRPELFLRNEVQ